MQETFTIENDSLRARFIARGASLIELFYKPLGIHVCPNLQDKSAFFAPMNYIGAIVGPIANRVAGARFSIGENRFTMDANEGRHCLHSGADGTSEQIWRVDARSTSDTQIKFHLVMKDFLGFSQFTVLWTLDDSALDCLITAQATIPPRGVDAGSRVFNLTPHLYFNLLGQGDILGHSLQVCADAYLPVDAEKIPTGQVAPVKGTPFDLTSAKPVGDVLRRVNLDHNFCLENRGDTLFQAVRLTAPNGLSLSVQTNQSGVQIYDGVHFNDSKLTHADQTPLPKHAALAIEPQGWPNAVNTPAFPSQIYESGEIYRNHSQFIIHNSQFTIRQRSRSSVFASKK